MKSWIVLGVLVAAISVSYAQPLCDFQGKDSVFAVVTGDTINVWDIAACAYCSATFRFSLSVTADSIYIVQTDTAGSIATCDCLFDLRTSVSGLPLGTYWVVIYRDLLKQFGYPSDLRQFIKSIRVNCGQTHSLNLSWNTYQSVCNPTTVPLDGQADPLEFVLYQNYPNPFNPSTTVRFRTSKSQYVVIKLFDLLGQEVQTLWSEQTPPGSHALTVEIPRNASSGPYFCRMVAGSFSQTIVMVLLR